MKKRKYQKQPLYRPGEEPNEELFVMDDVLDRVCERYLRQKESEERHTKKKKKKRRTLS